MSILTPTQRGVGGVRVHARSSKVLICERSNRRVSVSESVCNLNWANAVMGRLLHEYSNAYAAWGERREGARTKIEGPYI
jgi:hypothetical protein